jgi:Transposase DDE domain
LDVEPRLVRRYERLVKEHVNGSHKLSAGLKALPDRTGSFASTQAAWRFYGNEDVTLPKLQEPLTHAAVQGMQQHCDDYALCIHDWSRLAYKHANKPDTYAITHDTDIGYDLQTSLIVSDRQGQPLAPVAQRLVSSEGSLASYDSTAPGEPAKAHLDELTDCIGQLERQPWSKPLVHVIDREADSVGHMRAWEALGCHWLVRAKDNPRVMHNGRVLACKDVANTLSYERTRKVTHRGKARWQYVAQTDITITRDATPSQAKGKKPPVPGAPIKARLVVSRIMSEDGKKVLAQWLLISNVKEDVSAATLALWYYWRWRIESFFKLLKSAGHELEAWQQESAMAIAKRMLVASMACVTVWAIAADEGVQAAELRAFLVKLSGRQMKRDKDFTHPALLAGLWVWLSMLEVMDAYTPNELQNLKAAARQFLGG